MKNPFDPINGYYTDEFQDYILDMHEVISIGFNATSKRFELKVEKNTNIEAFKGSCIYNLDKILIKPISINTICLE